MTPFVAMLQQRVFFGPAWGRTVAVVIQINLAHSSDVIELERLAALDSADPLTGAVLVGRINGELRAARSLRDGRAIADPFVRSADLVKLLRLWTS
jgi:hypothetical protein